MSVETQKINRGRVTMDSPGVLDLIESTRKAIECDLQVTMGQPREIGIVEPVVPKASNMDMSSGSGSDVDSKSEGDGSDHGSSTSSSTSEKSSSKSFVPPANWANAPEFVPRAFVPAPTNSLMLSPRSYAQVVGRPGSSDELSIPSNRSTSLSTELCPYDMIGECRFGEQCAYLHGLKCEFCGNACLHPYNPEQREQHSRDCVKQHEKDMELSFAVARSSEKTCGICMETIMEKSPPGEQRFGILPSCIHCFCLSCIRKWRQSRQFENKIIRACPECRVASDYVCPSRYWVETKEEKDKLICSYLDSLSKKPCRYYRHGGGECPFGNKCFYLHALPDGTTVDVGPPRRRLRRQNASGVSSDSQPVSIWEFLEQWELQWFEIEDLMDLMDYDDDTSDGFDDEDDEIGYIESLESAMNHNDLGRFF